MTQPVVMIKGVVITNPTKVWHELKNSRAQFGPDGTAWLSGGWFNDTSQGMCLANMLRFVTHGYRDKPREMASQAQDQAEQLVTALAQEKVIRMNEEGTGFYNRAEDPHGEYDAEILRSAKEGNLEIPSFNDARAKGSDGFKPIADVLEEAADLVKPYAFTHSVTIAAEVMTEAEKQEIGDAVFEDGFGVTLQEWMTPKNTKARSKMEDEFSTWLHSFEDRGWDTFWKELADCDTPECEEARKSLAGVK